MSRRVAITGAGGGIGRALCPLLSDAGWSLTLIDRAESGVADLAAAHGAAAVEGTPLSVGECRAALLAGGVTRVDALVHLAGTFEPDPDLGRAPEIWQRTMHNNLDNAYNFATAIEDVLPDSQNGMQTGRLVFISSLAFRRGAMAHAAYSAAKGGLVGLTRSLARRFADRATVNALAPGIIDTTMPADIIRTRGDALRNEIPLKRYGTAHEVGTVIRFLLSADASYITGQTINVDGGHMMN